jgi:hypothetical protein
VVFAISCYSLLFHAKKDRGDPNNIFLPTKKESVILQKYFRPENMLSEYIKAGI